MQEQEKKCFLYIKLYIMTGSAQILSKRFYYIPFLLYKPLPACRSEYWI